MRDHSTDIAKALGIVLVVIGHSPLVLDAKGEPFRIVFSFHMPLFYFMAGFFLRAEQPLRVALRTRADTLLKPYFGALALMGGGLALATGAPLVAVMRAALTGTGEALGAAGGFPLVPRWFLPNLFATLLTGLLVVKAVQGMSRPAALLAIVSACGVVGGYWLLAHGTPRLPWSLDLLPLTLGFLLSGRLWARHSRVRRIGVVPVALAFALFCALHWGWDETIDLNARRFGDPVESLLQAFAGIYLVLSFATLLARVALVRDGLEFIGRSTLFILVFHAACMYVAKRVLGHAFAPAFIALMVPAAGLAGPLLLMAVVRRVPLLAATLLPAPRAVAAG